MYRDGTAFSASMDYAQQWSDDQQDEREDRQQDYEEIPAPFKNLEFCPLCGEKTIVERHYHKCPHCGRKL